MLHLPPEPWTLDEDPSEEMMALARRVVSQPPPIGPEDIAAVVKDIVDFGCEWDRQVLIRENNPNDVS